MDETTKSRPRRDGEGFDRYLRGRVIDIGCGEDKITPDADGWDKEDGDAQKLLSVPDAFYDTVYSSHCLEHMRDPLEALLNWWRVLRPGGYLIVAVPDEDLYEQQIWPSPFNTDHKWTFTISKDKSWSPAGRNLMDLVRHLPDRKTIYARTIDVGYVYGNEPGTARDQTLTGAEAQIEIVVQKLAGPGEAFSPCPQTFPCECRAAQFRLDGITETGAMRLACMHCGRVAELSINFKEK